LVPQPTLQETTDRQHLQVSIKMADNNTNRSQPNQAAPTQPMATPRTNIFGAAADAKRMSFDGNMPYSVSPTTGFGIASGLIGSVPSYNRDRRDSLKNMVHLQDFGTD